MSDPPLRIVDSPSLPSMLRDDWQLDEELREAQRLVRLVASQGRCDQNDGTASESTSTRPDSTTAARAKPASGGLFGWTLSGLGLSGLVCGCALLVWSLASGRDELWTIGLPTALVSQVVLICGILLRRDDTGTAGTIAAEPTATYVQVQSSSGGMHPSGLSVHFSNANAPSNSLNTDQLRREIEAVMRRGRAA